MFRSALPGAGAVLDKLKIKIYFLLVLRMSKTLLNIKYYFINFLQLSGESGK